MFPRVAGSADDGALGGGVEDPVVVEGDDLTRRSAFAIASRELQNRISIFVNLPLDSLDKWRLQEKLDEIGQIRLADTKEPAA